MKSDVVTEKQSVLLHYPVTQQSTMCTVVQTLSCHVSLSLSLRCVHVPAFFVWSAAAEPADEGGISGLAAVAARVRGSGGQADIRQRTSDGLRIALRLGQ